MVKRHVAAKLGTMVCTVYLSYLLGGGGWRGRTMIVLSCVHL
jgi:hypothetical protein